MFVLSVAFHQIAYMSVCPIAAGVNFNPYMTVESLFLSLKLIVFFVERYFETVNVGF